MTRVQKFVPVWVLLVMLLAVGWSFLPFEFAEGVKCGPPLLGAKPQNGEQSVGLILPKEDCLSKGKSRLLVSAMLALAVAGAGTAVLGLKPISPQCNGGNHDDCPYWWGNLLGEDSGIGCQCSCHTGVSSYF